MNKLLNINELAIELGVKPSWIRGMIFKKQIPYLKLGKHVRFEREVIRSWIIQLNSKKAGGYNG